MRNTSTLKNMGNNIKIARLKKAFTQDVLAEKCNVSTKYISEIERGTTSGSITLIIDICNALNISPNYIFGTSINNNNDNVSVLPNETSTIYLKLKNENKDFVNNTIKHLYSMQIKR